MAIKEVGPRSRTSLGWTDHTLRYYVEINTTGNKFRTRILCALELKSIWETSQCYLASKRWEVTDLRILYVLNILIEKSHAESTV